MNACIRRCGGAVALAIILCGLAATATAADDPQAVVTRTYDVRDLLLPMRHYPLEQFAAAGSTPTSRPASGADAAAATEAADAIPNLILTTVASDTWRDNGGTIGALTGLNGQLIVTQTPENHRQLEGLLRQLRAGHGRVVRATLTWVAMTLPEAAALHEQRAGATAATVVDDAAWAKLSLERFVARVVATAHPGQTIGITNGGAGAFDEGGTAAAAQVMVMPVEGEGTALVDVQAALSGEAGSQRVQTTARVPLDRPMVIAGGPAVALPDGPPRELYLVLQVSADPGPKP
ncbi:MAG TPA: hypothetical protein VK324_03540 [Tepidisphaeraceae bacterium]|nr:hypothetical protein [Tepidisphaeraceae bacterium]